MSLALVTGLFASAYLLFEYVVGGPIACGASGGCEVVRASDWAYLGPVPRPLLGVMFYVGMLILLVMRAVTPWQAPWLRRLTFIGAAIGLIESVHLFFVQWLSIQAFCTWCLVSGAATVIVFALACFDRTHLAEEERLHDLKGYVLSLFLLIIIGAPAFWFLIGV